MNNVEVNMQVWVVGVVLSAIMGTLGFLVRNAFTDVKGLLVEMGGKVDKLAMGQAEERGNVRVLEARVVALEKEMADLKHLVRDLSEGVAR